ncbi:unnamed protein product, partial [Didymodactylos carnosus]
ITGGNLARTGMVESSKNIKESTRILCKSLDDAINRHENITNKTLEEWRNTLSLIVPQVEQLTKQLSHIGEYFGSNAVHSILFQIEQASKHPATLTVFILICSLIFALIIYILLLIIQQPQFYYLVLLTIISIVIITGNSYKDELISKLKKVLLAYVLKHHRAELNSMLDINSSIPIPSNFEEEKKLGVWREVLFIDTSPASFDDRSKRIDICANLVYINQSQLGFIHEIRLEDLVCMVNKSQSKFWEHPVHIIEYTTEMIYMNSNDNDEWMRIGTGEEVVRRAAQINSIYDNKRLAIIIEASLCVIVQELAQEKIEKELDVSIVYKKWQ